MRQRKPKGRKPKISRSQSVCAAVEVEVERPGLSSRKRKKNNGSSTVRQALAQATKHEGRMTLTALFA